MTITYFHDDNSNNRDSVHKMGVLCVNVDEKIRTQVERLIKAAVGEAQIFESISWQNDMIHNVLRYQNLKIEKLREEHNSGDRQLVADVEAKPMTSFLADTPDDVVRAEPVDGRDIL